MLTNEPYYKVFENKMREKNIFQCVWVRSEKVCVLPRNFARKSNNIEIIRPIFFSLLAFSHAVLRCFHIWQFNHDSHVVVVSTMTLYFIFKWTSSSLNLRTYSKQWSEKNLSTGKIPVQKIFPHINTSSVSCHCLLREALPPLHVYCHDKSRHTGSVQRCGWIWWHTDLSLQHWRASLDQRESDWRWLEQSSWRTSWNYRLVSRYDHDSVKLHRVFWWV